MASSHQYTTLISSLPHPGVLFGATQTPLSRLKLDERLNMLEEDHLRLLRRVERSLLWSHQPIGRRDDEIIDNARRLLAEVDNPLLRELVEYRLEMRTAVAALRRRQRGEDAPDPRTPWGFGRWVDHIRRHWSEPAFRLQGVFPWLPRAHQLMQEGDTLALERLLLDVAWQHLGRASAGHHFDFEAVVIYLLRWSIIQRWVHYDAEIAARRFASLVDEGLGEYAELFAED